MKECPECESKDLTHYYQTLKGYSVQTGEFVGEKDWGCDYSFYKCEDCGWNDC